MRVLVMYTAPPDDLPPGRRRGEFDLSARRWESPRSFRRLRWQGARRGGRDPDPARREKPDVVYNLCEAPLGRPDLEASAVALLEWAGVRFTGAGVTR